MGFCASRVCASLLIAIVQYHLIPYFIMRTFELTPVNSIKSFGGKCRVYEEHDISYLYSYGVKVAHFEHRDNKMVVNGWFSAATATHINAFLVYYGFDTCTKSQLKNYNK